LPASAQVVTSAQVNGTWRDRTKFFKVWALGDQRLKIEYTYEYKARGGWTANTGEASGIANIEGIIATFRPDGADEGCKITMTFKGDRLVVDQKDGCGFGLNVTASGTYRKTSSRKPNFDN
jgi:hypothetical protein